MKRLASFLVTVAFLINGCYSYGSQNCQPHAQNCWFVSNQWIPTWMYTALQDAQHTKGTPSLKGKQPTEKQVLAHGATFDEAKNFVNNQ